MHSKLYKRPKYTDNTVVRLIDGRIGQIQYFSLIDDQLYMFLKEFNTQAYSKEFFNAEKKKNEIVTLKHLLVVNSKKTNNTKVSINLFSEKLLHIELENIQEYVCILPPLYDVK